MIPVNQIKFQKFNPNKNFGFLLNDSPSTDVSESFQAGQQEFERVKPKFKR